MADTWQARLEAASRTEGTCLACGREAKRGQTTQEQPHGVPLSFCEDHMEAFKRMASKRMNGRNFQAVSRGLVVNGLPGLVETEFWLSLQDQRCSKCEAEISPWDPVKPQYIFVAPEDADPGQRRPMFEAVHSVAATCRRVGTCRGCGYQTSDKREVPGGLCSPCRALERALMAHPRREAFLERRRG